ncbi:MAG: hypothetical protein P1V97_12325 [Planctomycetota bacterium]|nr:hypothetical protein [Planctomycetota bacterium]
MAISFVCVCQTPYTAEDYQAGQQFTCPTCHQVVVIPGVPAAPPPAPNPEVSQNQQGWAGNFFEGKAEPTKSKGAQMLAELDATSDAAMDDELLGRSRSKAPAAPKPTAPPAQFAPQAVAPTQPALGRLGDMELLPDSDIAEAPEGMDAAMNEVANLFEAAPKSKPKAASSSRRPKNTSSERPRNQKGARRPTDQSASRKRRRTTEQNNESSRGRRKGKSSRAPAAAPAGNAHFIVCSVCEEQIARKARECPYCQAPVPRAPGFAEKNEQLIQYAKIGGGILALLILVGVAFKLMGGSGETRKRRRSKKIVASDNIDTADTKDDEKDKKDDPDKDKVDPKKEPDKKPDIVKVDPNKDDPLGAFKKVLEPLRKANDPADIEAQIAALAKNPLAKEICQAVIKVERDTILVGMCYRVLYAATEGAERDNFLRRGLNANTLDAVYGAADIVLAENKAGLKKQMLSGRRSSAAGRRFGALYGLALLESDSDGPTAKDLRKRALVMEGNSSCVRPRLAVLRLLAGDGLVIEEALKAFDFDHPRLRQTAHRAFEHYSGKNDIVLSDPGSSDAAKETKEKWLAWYESYKPFLEPLARACTDPNAVSAISGERGKLQEAARKQRHDGIKSLLAIKDTQLISYMRTFAKAEASAKTEQGHRTLALLIEQVAQKDEFPILFRWLDEIKTVDSGAKYYAAAILSAAGKEAVPAALRLMERGVLKPQQLAKIMPDLGRVKCEELDALEAKMEEIKAGNAQEAEPYWFILASLGSKLVEDYLTDKKRSESTAIGVMARYGDKKFEKQLFSASIGETKIPNLDAAQAARYLSLGGSSNISKAVIGLLKEPKHANIANQLIIGLASPKFKKQLFSGLTSDNGSLATVCIRTLIDMNFTDRGTASKYAAMFNKSDCPHYLKVHLKKALIAMRVTGKKQPRAFLIEETERWRANVKRWEKTKSGLHPSLKADVIQGLGRVGDRKDSQILIEALGSTQSNSDREKILTALGHLKAKDGAFTMRGYLLPNRRARGIAALALAQIKDKTALGELKFVLTDSKRLDRDDGQVFMAISLIDPIAGWTTYKVVKEKKVPTGGGSFPGIAFALVREPEAEGLSELQSLINNPDPKARAGIGYGIALALAYKRAEVAPGLADFLKPLLFDESPEVRINTLLALLALKADFVGPYIYSVLKEDSTHFKKMRNDAFSEYLEPEYTNENFEQWIYRLAKKSAGYRNFLSKGFKREIRESFRKVKKR